MQSKGWDDGPGGSACARSGDGRALAGALQDAAPLTICRDHPEHKFCRPRKPRCCNERCCILGQGLAFFGNFLLMAQARLELFCPIGASGLRQFAPMVFWIFTALSRALELVCGPVLANFPGGANDCFIFVFYCHFAFQVL